MSFFKLVQYSYCQQEVSNYFVIDWIGKHLSQSDLFEKPKFKRQLILPLCMIFYFYFLHLRYVLELHIWKLTMR